MDLNQLRDAILAANDRTTAPVDTREWKCGQLFVRSLSAVERKQLADRTRKMKGTPQERHVDGLIAANVLSDSAGNRLFADEHAAALSEKNAAVLDRIVAAYGKLNALDEDEKRELEKNS